MLMYVWLPLLFLLGAMVGSFVNVCISRLPLEKSLFWPLRSYCGHCLQPIRWYDNIPLVSYWWLRGRCRKCGASFSIRYFLIELATGLGFVLLFYLEVLRNVHDLAVIDANMWAIRWGVIPWQGWVFFAYHAILFSLLMAAAGCDLDGREIPLTITFPGTLIGLVGAMLFPWPWPYTPAEALKGLPLNQGWGQLPFQVGPKAGLYPWPVWGPPPDWLPPGSWQLGLATGLAGMLAGTLMLRVIGFIFGKGLGKEAMGLGDADLMMMAGSFLGWQPIVVAFFISVFPGLVMGVFQLIIRRDNSLPFGPALAAGVVITWLGWNWIGPRVQPMFFWDVILFAMAGLAVVLMVAFSLFFWMVRPRQEQESEECKVS
jgi:leader peptidase (prepilin peptidase)/N-methyltransferase